MTSIQAEQRHLDFSGHHLSPYIPLLLTLTYRYLAYYPILDCDMTIKCFCDNSGISTNLTNLQQMTTLHPNDTMNNDMDLYMEINATARSCTCILFQYLHVKGHQDAKTNHQLTTTEQHNVDCDRHAKDHVQQQHPPSTLYGNPAFEVARPHLCIHGKIICHDFLPTLQQTVAIPEYWEYLKKCFHWMHLDVKNVHWKSLQMALVSFQWNDQWQLILFMHGKLPL